MAESRERRQHQGRIDGTRGVRTGGADATARRDVLRALLFAALLGPGIAMTGERKLGGYVEWVPTPPAMVEKMLDAARVGPKDHLVDLGAGDGRFMFAAASRGASATGIEIDPGMVAFGNARAAKEGLAGRVHFLEQDLFTYDLGEATVVSMYLLSEMNLKLRPKILALRPGTCVLAFQFGMGDWPPEKTLVDGDVRGYLWTVPAQVAGGWTVEGRGHSVSGVRLAQTYQTVSGALRTREGELGIDGMLEGEVLRFVVTGRSDWTFRGIVRGDRIEGELSRGVSAPEKLSLRR